MRFVSLVAAALAAVGGALAQSGNPIAKPGLNEQVPAGIPYTITWAVRSPPSWPCLAPPQPESQTDSPRSPPRPAP